MKVLKFSRNSVYLILIKIYHQWCFWIVAPLMDCKSTMGHLDDRKSTWRTNSRPNSLYSCIQHLEYFLWRHFVHSKISTFSKFHKNFKISRFLNLRLLKIKKNLFFKSGFENHLRNRIKIWSHFRSKTVDFVVFSINFRVRNLIFVLKSANGNSPIST